MICTLLLTCTLAVDLLINDLLLNLLLPLTVFSFFFTLNTTPTLAALPPFTGPTGLLLNVSQDRLLVGGGHNLVALETDSLDLVKVGVLGYVEFPRLRLLLLLQAHFNELLFLGLAYAFGSMISEDTSGIAAPAHQTTQYGHDGFSNNSS